jgi:hypothetical protein
MTAEEVRTLPMAQKMQIMEVLWEDLRDRFENAEVPERLKDVLDQRRARARDGSAKILDWDSVKSGIGRA